MKYRLLGSITLKYQYLMKSKSDNVNARTDSTYIVVQTCSDGKSFFLKKKSPDTYDQNTQHFLYAND